MSAPINFITPTRNVRLSKTITANDVTPYPRVASVTSISHHVEESGNGLAELYRLLLNNADAGNALLKGPLREPVVKASRSGKSDKTASTPFMVLDIDGWIPETKLEAPITQADLLKVAESVITLLPEPLCSTSYIVNASSSTGIKPTGEVGLHFFFLLDTAIHPSYLEAYFKSLNFASETIAEKLTLQSSNMSLKWIVDPVVARNAQLVYIAHPTFEGRDDPFASPTDRWALNRKERDTCDIHQQIMSVDHAEIDGKANKLLNKLRNERGLGKFKPRTRTMTLMGQQQRVMVNPDRLEMVHAGESDEFVYWNINGGDSKAYFNPKANPEVIYNFKGEPPFLFREANKELYNQYIADYQEVISKVQETRPLLIRDPDRDEIFAVEYVPAHNEVMRINKIIRQNAEDWLAGFGVPMVDSIPSWDVTFDPHSVNEIDWDGKILNTYRATEYLKNPPIVMPQYQKATRETAVDSLKELCPTIFDVLYHIAGSSKLELGYFLNWLAFGIQKRDKTRTAWVFSGVPGTGKGVFYERILRPIMGQDYTILKRLDHLEEQFNAYQERALFLIWEEFRLQDSNQSGKLLNKMKDDIVADTVSIRAMRTDVRPAPSYTNYIFFSNHTDVIPVEKGDRRFNIAPPQLERLEHTYPDIRQRINENHIEYELGSFAGFMLAFDINEQEATTERNNEAKEQMRLASMTPMDQFANAIVQGDLEFFYRVEDIESVNSVDMSMRVKVAQASLNKWKEDALNNASTVVTIDALQVCFEVIFSDRIPAIRLQSALAKRDVIFKRERTGSGKRKSCVRVEWKVTDKDERALLATDIQTYHQQHPADEPSALMH
ncbi:primase-helicase family protein [Vreelandella massiliensis]|uniref:primase-helicase family protein n=1 Tax=Vreelandella massiliensis TaxID=1816686 RepID=UPI00096A2D6C|nr:DUF5906 domain-containing protein [Halomonas massiliensis]